MNKSWATTIEKGILRCLPDRSADRLETRIIEHVFPSSVIHTDKWTSYRNPEQLGYVHWTMNHFYIAVDPEPCICTNHIETYWSSLKQNVESKPQDHRRI